ncbi:TylF/MycF/NovP-related O-methyltransferase [Synechococcus sp. W55.2]|uniref:TylF/MycF/NovP-related O-methyltransferase n=1 Tax=Synechococcus sp. W55.2 TaxID=2964513 RepID=UPI0039C02588
MNSTIIVTAADSKFFELVQGTILSIREKPQGHSVDIGFLDVGCTPEQLQWIGQYVDHIVEPGWNYDIPDIDRQPKYLKALVSRPFLPEYFPGYEVYIWIDADAWVQDWSAIYLLALGAKRKGFAIVPELFAKHSTRSLRHAWIALQYSRYFHYTDFAGLEIEPLLNAGVFSGTGRSPHWSAWSRRLSQAIYNCLDILTDQFALNVAIYKDLGLDRVELLPLSCNWLANYQELLWDPRRRLWVDPSSPHTPLCIVHISGQTKEKPTHIVPTTEGFRVETYLSYPIEKLTSVKRYDYVSANQKIVNLDPCFPFLAATDPQSHPWPYVRREVPHLLYADQRQPSIGFVSRDEAHILYNTALKLQGKNALEIGCWLGWSTAHLAAGGVILDVVDPILENPLAYESVNQSLCSAGVRSNVNLYPGYSPGKVEEIAQQEDRRWSLIFIDGNHDSPAPLQDAQVAERYAAEDALILFHDLASPDVAEGLNYLRDRGWNTMIYQTMQIMGVAWRGNVKPVEHIPDPAVNWTLPEHLKDYPVCNLELSRVLEKVKSFTLLGFERLWSLYSLAKQVCEEDIPGNFVECGVCRGGSSALLAWVIKNYSRRPRKLYAFDTFSGMPEPTEVDIDYRGVAANDTGFGSGALAAPISENLEVIARELGVWDLIVPVPGLFSDTLPVYREQVGEIALLHADADWYQSAMDIFRHLYHQVNPRGFIQVDDYQDWQECAKAVHDFEQELGVFFRLHSVAEPYGWKPDSLEVQGWPSAVWLSPSENWLVITDGSIQTFKPEGIRLSKINVGLFPYWEMETEQLVQELEVLLESILRSPNPEDYALIFLGDPDPKLANQTLEIAAGNVVLKLMEVGLELGRDPFSSVVAGLNPHQWERLIPQLNYRYPLKHERFPQGLRLAVQRLPVL